MKRFLEDPSTVKKNCKASLRYNSRRGIKVMNRRGKLKLKRLKMLWKNFGQNFQFSLEKDGNIQANLPSQFLLQTKLRHFRFGFKIVFQEAQCSRNRERVWSDMCSRYYKTCGGQQSDRKGGETWSYHQQQKWCQGRQVCWHKHSCHWTFFRW